MEDAGFWDFLSPDTIKIFSNFHFSEHTQVKSLSKKIFQDLLISTYFLQLFSLSFVFSSHFNGNPLNLY